jgi:hypothetical protein
MDMVRWLTVVASFTAVLLFLASPGAAQPLTGHASSDDVLAAVSIVATAQGRIGDRAAPDDFELGLGQTAAVPFFPGQLDWVSGQTYDWTLTYEQQSFGGAVEFEIAGFSGRMPVFIEPNSLFIRTQADLPDTGVVVDNLILGLGTGSGDAGLTIYETADPTTAASSVAGGSGLVLDILKISGEDLSGGFTLRGQVTLVFENADPQPTGDQLAFQLFVADDGNPPGVIDSDGDGWEDGSDNCKYVANPDQADFDGDDRGDACDSCPSHSDPAGADGDGDGIGDACDNCNVGCNSVLSATGLCQNRLQRDSDGDLVGDLCDNCRFVKNGPGQAPAGGPCSDPVDGLCVGNQLDSDGDGEGDACRTSVVIQDIGGGAALPGGITPGVGALSQDVGIAAAGTNTINMSLDCGQDIEAANIGLLLPTGSTFENFAGCISAPPGPDNRHDCTSAPDLGLNVSNASFTIGPNISIAGSPPAEMVILRLQGTSGTGNNLLCSAGEKVSLGPLRVLDLPDFTSPSVRTTGFDTFTPPLALLVAPGDAPVPEAQILAQVNPPEESRLTLSLRPAVSDPERRYELRVNSTRRVFKLAIGINVKDAVVTPADVQFGDCTISPAQGPGGATVPFSDVRGCPGSEAAPDIGPAVAIPTFFLLPTLSLPATFTVGPETTAGLEANTLYVAVQGADGGGINPTPGEEALVGILEFAAEVAPDVDITFAGADQLPGYLPADGGAIQTDLGDVTPNNVSLSYSFDGDEDTDGDGVGDEVDNCVLVPNGPADEDYQSNSGGVGFVADANNFDNIGTICTCGDPGFDGIVDDGTATADTEGEQDDVEICQQLLSGQQVVDPADAERCQVTPGTGSFGIVDVVVLEIETAGGDAGTGDPLTGSLQACSAADAPQ